MGYTILTLLVLFFIVAWVHWNIKRGAKNRYAKMNAYVERERQANLARRKEIDARLFFTADMAALPADGFHGETEKLHALRERTLRLAAGKMIKLDTPMSNTEIKERFGAVNLDVVTACEERYEQFARALLDWAEALAEAGQKMEAERIVHYLQKIEAGYTKRIGQLLERTKSE